MQAALGVFLFTSLWFLGADHGQLLDPPSARTAVADAKPQQRAGCIPAQPVVRPVIQPVADPAPNLVEQAVEQVVALAVAQAVAVSMQVEAPAPVTTKVMHAPGGATVRSGPGRKFPAVGRFRRGKFPAGGW